jgi:hypothetical protein
VSRSCQSPRRLGVLLLGVLASGKRAANYLRRQGQVLQVRASERASAPPLWRR